MDENNSNDETTTATRLLSDDLFGKMAHAIGHRLAPGCSTSGGRNCYAGSPDDPDWAEAIERGLASTRTSPLMRESVYYHVSPKGLAAVEHDAVLREGGPVMSAPTEPTTSEQMADGGRAFAICFAARWNALGGKATLTESPASPSGPKHWRLELATGGRSDVESFLADVPLVWHVLFWQSSHRGGLHVYASQEATS